MSDGKHLLWLAGGVGTSLLGGLFFFVIIGVFGLRLAITGLLIFVVGAVVICRALPTEGEEL